MAPTQLLLEGPAIEPLLQKVRAEHGPGVRIVKAERVRVGGFVGFFAREQFEVTVEVDASGSSLVPAAPAPRPAPTSVPELGAGGLDALLAAAERADQAVSLPTQAAFEAVLSSIHSGTAPPAPAVPAVPAVPAAVPAPVPAPVALPESRLLEPPAAQAQPAQSDPLPREPAALAPAPDPVREPPAPTAPPVPAPAAHLPAPAVPDVPPQAAGWRAVVPAPRVQPAPEPAPPTRRSRHRSARAVVEDGCLAERLAALGVPTRWLPDLPEGRTEALRHVAERIAATPAQSRRQATLATSPVVVVLADLAEGLPVARQLAVGLGLDAAEVAVMHARVPGVARDRCLAARPDVLAEVDRARSRGRALVLALPAPVGAAPAARAALADTLLLLRPDEVWAVVDATRRLEDTTTWLTALAGDRGVDAVALVNTGVSSAPAAALDLPAPVVLMGERPATPQAWVSLLAARLVEQDLA